MSNSSWNSLAVISINNISPIIVQTMVTSSSTLKTTMILSLSNTWTMTLLLNKIFTLWTIKQKYLSWNSFLGSNYQFLNNSSPVYSPMKRIVLYSCVVAFHNFTQKMTIWQEKMTIWQEIFFYKIVVVFVKISSCKESQKMTYGKKKCVFNKKTHFELLYITLWSFGIKHFLVKICKINKKCWCTCRIFLWNSKCTRNCYCCFM